MRRNISDTTTEVTTRRTFRLPRERRTRLVINSDTHFLNSVVMGLMRQPQVPLVRLRGKLCRQPATDTNPQREETAAVAAERAYKRARACCCFHGESVEAAQLAQLLLRASCQGPIALGGVHRVLTSEALRMLLQK